MEIKSFIQRRQLLSYFILTYGITWTGIIILLVLKSFNFQAIRMPEILIIFLLMLVGPSTASIILNFVIDGKAGIHELKLHLTTWRITWHWYAVALLTIPFLVLTILLLLKNFISPVYTPGFNIVGIAIGLLAGYLEEIGWTGFASPRLLNKYKPLTAGLILGLLWSLWHLMADFSGNFISMGPKWLLWFALYWILPLTAYRILMTWVYSNTKSILIAQLMHASYTGWLFVLSPTASFSQNLLWQSILGISLWVLVLIIFTQTDKRWEK